MSTHTWCVGPKCVAKCSCCCRSVCLSISFRHMRMAVRPSLTMFVCVTSFVSGCDGCAAKQAGVRCRVPPVEDGLATTATITFTTCTGMKKFGSQNRNCLLEHQGQSVNSFGMHLEHRTTTRHGIAVFVWCNEDQSSFGIFVC